MTTNLEVLKELKVFLERLKLKDVRCVSLNANLINDTGLAPTMSSFSFLENAEYGLKDSFFLCRVAGVAKFTNGSELIAEVKVDFVIFHEVSEGPEVSPSVMEAFIQHNALFIAYPYFREAIHNTCARLGLGNLVLEILKRD